MPKKKNYTKTSVLIYSQSVKIGLNLEKNILAHGKYVSKTNGKMKYAHYLVNPNTQHERNCAQL